jgi:ribosome maturation factor RimP
LHRIKNVCTFAALILIACHEREPKVPSFYYTYMELPERIGQLLDEKFATDPDFADCFTVDIQLKNTTLAIFVDSDSGMTFEKCRKISRYLEQPIDANGWLGDKYVLEVSSPGVTRPLKFARQYRNNLGRTLEVVLSDKTKHLGTLTAADDQQIVLSYTVIEKEGKKKKEVPVVLPILFENIEKAVVKINFKS